MAADFSDPQTYYAEHGVITDPGLFGQQFAVLPHGLGDLCQVVQGFLLHVFWAEKYGLEAADIRREEAGIRRVERMLAIGLDLDPRPFTSRRLPSQRLIGNCRNFSILLCALLRHQGVPARVRCGFAKYFITGHHEDHWVCEFWQAAEKRWVLVDAQLDSLQCQALQITFDPLDVPRDQFLVAGRAWQLCRNHEADPETFGIFDMHGQWFVRGNLVRDIAALNKIPLLPWDGWGLIDRPEEDLSTSDLDLLDYLANASAGEIDYQAVRRHYSSDDRLRVPQVINSYSENGVIQVDLAAEASPE